MIQPSSTSGCPSTRVRINPQSPTSSAVLRRTTAQRPIPSLAYRRRFLSIHERDSSRLSGGPQWIRPSASPSIDAISSRSSSASARSTRRGVSKRRSITWIGTAARYSCCPQASHPLLTVNRSQKAAALGRAAFEHPPSLLELLLGDLSSSEAFGQDL